MNGMLVQQWHYWVFGSIGAFVLWIGPTALIVRDGITLMGGLQVAANLSLVIFVGAACFGMIAMLLRYGTVHWPINDPISENAYGIYFFHYTIAVWLQFALLRIALPAVAKGLVVLAGTLLLSLVASVLTNRIIATAAIVLNKLRRCVLQFS